MIGRESELRLVERFLERGGPGTRGLMLYGEAGIGKTTLWLAALEEAARRGYRVMSTRPTQAEARLPFAGLSDLLADLVDDCRPDLPPPQQAALDVALMRTSSDDMPIQPLALPLATLGVLRSATEQQPLALGVDDAQWLDDSSTGILRFVLRRLETERLVVIGAERVSASGMPASFLTELPNDRLTRVAVRTLDPEEVDRLLREALDLELRPTELRRLHRLSGGNPFYAVEIGRALQRRGRAGGEDIALPESLSVLLRTRLEALSPEAREVVVTAAALSKPTTAMLDAALGHDRARSGLAEARRTEMLATDSDPILFSHPLLAAEAYAGIGEADRRELHRRLASIASEPEEVARHLALAGTGPDPIVADALDAAAIRAHGRGAPDAAAELSEMAARLTDPGDARQNRRLAAAGGYLLMAGEIGRARGLLEQVLDASGDLTGPGRAELLLQLGRVRQLMDDFVAAERVGIEALPHAAGNIPLTIEIKLLIAGSSHVSGRNWMAGAQHAFEAMRLAEELGDQRTLAGTIGHYAIWRYATGHGFEPRLAQRATALEPWTKHLRALDHPSFDFLRIQSYEGHTQESGEQLRRLLQRAERDGDYSSLPYLLGMHGLEHALNGHVAAAREDIERAQRLAKVTSQRAAEAHCAVYRAQFEARLGNADAAWAAAREARDHMAATSWTIGEWAMRHELGLLELSRNDPASALEAVAGAVDPPETDESESWEWGRSTAVEALVALGRLDEARRVFDAFDRYVQRVQWPIFVARASRARARVLAAEGELDAASVSISEAEEMHRRFQDRWELPRTLLLAGEIHRRARRRARARSVLREALAGFELIGARLWANQARQHLERIGAAREGGQGLTPTQREVAELVIFGLTNRQVADRLFMSAHTVEAHLSAIYRTLEIRSRVELEGALSRLEGGLRDSRTEIRDSADPATAKG